MNERSDQNPSAGEHDWKTYRLTVLGQLKQIRHDNAVLKKEVSSLKDEIRDERLAREKAIRPIREDVLVSKTKSGVYGTIGGAFVVAASLIVQWFAAKGGP